MTASPIEMVPSVALALSAERCSCRVGVRVRVRVRVRVSVRVRVGVRVGVRGLGEKSSG